MRTLPLLTLLLVAAVTSLTAQPAWVPLGPILGAPAVGEIVGTAGGGLVVSPRAGVEVLADGRWITPAGLPEAVTLAYRFVRSSTGRLYLRFVGHHVSTDDGRTWTPTTFEVLAANDRALIGTDVGVEQLAVSRDEGATWSPMVRPFAGPFLSIAAHPAVRQMLAANVDGREVAISSDEGAGWTDLTDRFDGGLIRRVRVLPSAMFVVTMHDGSQSSTLWRSSDRGSTWAAIAQSDEIITDVVEDAGGRIVRLDGSRGYISQSNGASWGVLELSHCDEHVATPTALALDAADRIVVGTNDDGIFRFDADGLREIGFRRPIGPAHLRLNLGLLYGASSSRGWISGDRGGTWECLRGGPEAFDADGGWYRSRTMVERSTDHGVTWSVVGGLVAPEGYQAHGPVTSARGTILATFRYDIGSYAASGVLRLGRNLNWMTIERHRFDAYGELLASPDSAIYYLNSGRLDRSTDDGASWTTVDSTSGISVITAAADGTLYALGPWGDDRPVLRSTDGGATWARLDWGAIVPETIAASGAGAVLAVYTDAAGARRVGYSGDRGATFAPMTQLGDAIPHRLYQTGPDITVLSTSEGLFRLDEVSGVEAAPEIPRMDLSVIER